MTILDDYLPIEEAGEKAYRAFSTWTVEDAMRAQKSWDNKAHHPNDHGPLFQWVAALKLKDLADDYLSTGEKARILEALFLCNRNKMAIPRWCSSAFIAAYREVWIHLTILTKSHSMNITG